MIVFSDVFELMKNTKDTQGTAYFDPRVVISTICLDDSLMPNI
jgi:hypothetical protein